MTVTLETPTWFWREHKMHLVKKIEVSPRTALVVVGRDSFVVIPTDHTASGLMYRITESEETLKKLGLQYERMERK